MAQPAPGASTGGQLLLWEKSPSSRIALRWSGACPVLTSLMVSEPLLPPRFWAKISDWLVKLAADCARLPVSGTDCDAPPDDPLPPASSLTVSVPLRVFLSSAPIWLSVMEVMWSRPPPLFVRVTVAGVAGALIG